MRHQCTGRPKTARLPIVERTGGANASRRVVFRPHRRAWPGSRVGVTCGALSIPTLVVHRLHPHDDGGRRVECQPHACHRLLPQSTPPPLRPQALAWMLFLPTEVSRTAAIEIALRTRQRRIRNECYKDWAEALGVRYWQVGAAASVCPARKAVGRRERAVNPTHLLNECNVTVDVDELLRVVGVVASWIVG